MRSDDVVRELQKAENVLGMVERYLMAYGESMAALHLSERVIPSPLTAAVMQARLDLKGAESRLASEEKSPDRKVTEEHLMFGPYASGPFAPGTK